MTYTINENAKNVWIRDNENTQDLSLQTEAKLVYLNNGRTLEQELGEGSMVSNVATVDKQMSSVIDGTFDGAYEECVLEGRTLVNLIASQTPIRQTLVTNDYEIKYLKANTKYMAIFEITSNGTNNRAGILINDATWNSENILCQKGWNKIIITTTTETTIGFRIRHAGTETTQITSSNVVLIEYQDGLENIDIPFFEGMCDVKMPILRNVGKNLFDLDTYFEKVKHLNGVTKIENGIKLDCDVNVSVGNAIRPYRLYENFDKLTSYTISFERINTGSFMADLSVVYTDGTSTRVLDLVTTPNNKTINYVEITWATQVSGGKTELKNIQIEKGDKSAYESYKTNILQTSEEIVLRSLPNGTKDTYNALTGEYVQRIGEREYQIGDEDNVAVMTDMTKTQYVLLTPITTTVNPIGIPFVYANGHVILESGYEGQSLLPTLSYSTVINRTGQIQAIDKAIQKQEQQITSLEKMLIQGIVNMNYTNVLQNLNIEIDEVK